MTSPTRPSRVSVCECWPRDGIQGWPAFVPTDRKLEVIAAVRRAGVGELDATSFMPATNVPQTADADELLRGLGSGMAIRVLVVNERGLQRALAAQRATQRITTVGFPISASEPHNLANLRRDHASHLKVLAGVNDRCRAAGIEPLLSVATSFGCPIAGAVDPELVFRFVDWGAQRRVRRIMLGDTTGMASPDSAFALFSESRARWPDVAFVAHFHDNRGRGVANTLAAIDAGVAVVDSSLGGTGGEPRIVEQGDQGVAGNVCTEDLVATLDAMGIETGIDLDALLDAGRTAEAVMGERLGSRVLRAGLR